jgi:branched-chain amino acid transport system substrate-binding protein
MKKHLAQIGALAVALTALAACSSSGGSTAQTSAASSSPVSVLVITDTSGADKSFGSQQALGFEAAAAYLNAHGGILGRHVNVTILPDNADASTATSGLIKALTTSSGKYSLVWAGEEGTVIDATIPIITRYKLFGLAPNDGDDLCADASQCPTVFTMSGNSGVFPQGAAAFFKSKGYTNVGIADEQIDFDQAQVPELQATLTKDGIKSETASFPATAVDVAPEVSSLRSAGAQAVFAPVLGAADGYVLNARAGLGWNVPVVLDVGGSSFDIPQLAPASELGDVYESPFYCENPDNTIPGWSLLNKYSPTPLSSSEPCSQAGFAWDAMMTFRNAAVKAGSVNASALETAMLSLKETSANSDMVDFQQYCWSATDHENVCQQPSDYAITPVGSIIDSRLKESAASS